VSPSGWKACLAPTKAATIVTVTASCTGCTGANKTAVLSKVTFGDVWYCGGQSNSASPRAPRPFWC